MKVYKEIIPTYTPRRENLPRPVHVLDPDTGEPAVMDVDGSIIKYDDYAGAVSVTEGTSLGLKETLEMRKRFADATGLESRRGGDADFGRRIEAFVPVETISKEVQLGMDAYLKQQLGGNQSDRTIPANSSYLGRSIS